MCGWFCATRCEDRAGVAAPATSPWVHCPDLPSPTPTSPGTESAGPPTQRHALFLGLAARPPRPRPCRDRRGPTRPACPRPARLHLGHRGSVVMWKGRGGFRRPCERLPHRSPAVGHAGRPPHRGWYCSPARRVLLPSRLREGGADIADDGTRTGGLRPAALWPLEARAVGGCSSLGRWAGGGVEEEAVAELQEAWGFAPGAGSAL